MPQEFNGKKQENGMLLRMSILGLTTLMVSVIIKMLNKNNISKEEY